MREAVTSSFPHCVSLLATTCLSSCVWRLHYTSPLLTFFSLSLKAYYNFNCARSLSLSQFTPFSVTPLLCPHFFFFSLRLKHMQYFQPWLRGVDRQSRTMAAFYSHGPAFRGAASIFVYCQFKQANAASLLLTHCGTMVE